MSQSHTGRNGLIVESTQTTNQRTRFESTMDVTGQNTDNLKSMFAGSPIHMDDAARVIAFGSGRDDNGYVRDGDPYTDFAAFRVADVSSGFGFEGITVSMNYSSSGLNVDEHGIVTPDSTGTSDIHDGANSLKGHPNLRVNKFSTEDFDNATDVQFDRNADIPGENVDASRSDTLGAYFTGAGNR